MKEKIEIINVKYRITVISFLFFMLIFSISPLSGDVIDEFLLNSNLFDFFKSNDSSMLVSFFANNKFIFNLILSGLIAVFIHNVNSLITNIRNKYFYLFILIEILLVSYFTFAYNYMSVRGALLFTVPSILMFLYFINLNKILKKFDRIVLFIILSIIIINLNVVLGIYFLIGNLLYFYFNKEFDRKTKLILLGVQLINILSVIGLNNIDSSFIVNDAIAIRQNISLSIKNLFSNNILLFIIGVIPINYYLKDNLKANMYRRIKLFVFNIPLIFSIFYNFANYIPVNFELILVRYSGVFAVENYYYLGYFLVYIYFLILTINHFVSSNKIRSILNTTQLISLLILIQSIITNDFDYGLNIFIILNLCLTSFILFTEIKIKIYPRLTILATVLLFLYYIVMFSTIRILENKRVNYIDKQIIENKEKIVITGNPFRLLLNMNPSKENYEIVKKYYKIPDEKKIEVKFVGILEKIEKKVK